MTDFRLRASELVSGVSAATGAAVAGASAPAAATVGAFEVVAQLHTREHAARLQRAAAALSLTSELSGLTIEQVRDRVARSPHQLLLLSEVLQAAEATLLEDKARRLAQLLAAGLAQPDTVDVCRLHTSVLADLEGPHLLVMRLLTAVPVSIDDQDREWESSAQPAGWQRRHLGSEVPALGAAVDVVLATLVRHGLVLDLAAGTYGGGGHEVERFALTDMGREILHSLEDAIAATQPDQ